MADPDHTIDAQFEVTRPLTYAECIAQGCSEEEAIDYLKEAPHIEVRYRGVVVYDSRTARLKDA